MAHKRSYSIVIPLFNEEKSIERAIDSVLAQDHNLEIVVVNDGSTDRGPRLVEKRNDPRIRLIHQTNQGVSAARNNGIKHCKSELIGLLDADDIYLPNFLDMIDELVERYPSAGAYTTSFQYTFEDGVFDSRHPKIKRPYFGIPDYFYCAGFDKYFCASSIVLRKSAIMQIGGFDTSLNYGEDTDAWGRLALSYPIAHRSDVGAKYIRCGDTHASLDNELVLEPCIGFAIEHLRTEGAVDNESLLTYVNNYLCRYAAWSICSGRPSEGRAALARRPSNKRLGKILSLYILSLYPSKLIQSARAVWHKITESGTNWKDQRRIGCENRGDMSRGRAH